MIFLQPSEHASSRGEAVPGSGRLCGTAARLGGGTIIIGGVILLGWLIDAPLLKSWLPGQVEAKPNAGLCFMLAGLALFLKSTAAGMRHWRARLATIAALGVALIGLATITEYLFSWDLGHDRLLFRTAVSAVPTAHPGRISLPSACNFLLVGWALMVLRPARDSRLVVWLSVPVAVLASCAFVGQLYNLPWLTALGPFTPISLPSGTSFLILSAGLLLASSSDLGAWLRRSGHIVSLVVGLLLVLLLGGGVARNASALIVNTRHVTHTYEVLDRLGLMLSAMQDVETASRGYVLTGDEEFLVPYQVAPADIGRRLDELRTLTIDNPVQRHRLLTLQAHADRKLAAAAEQIARRKNGDLAGARELVADGHGRRAMDAVRQDIADLRAEEVRLLGERGSRLDASTSRTLVTFIIGLVVALLLLLSSFTMLRREMARRTQIASELRRSEESLAITLNSIGDGVLATDTSGRLTMLNPVAEQLTGWTQAEAQGRPVAEIFRIIHEDTREPAKIPVAAVLATGEIMELANHTVLIARDGSERAIADSAAPIRDRAGELIGVVLVFRDVGESRRAQAELDRFFSLSLDFLGISSSDGYFKRVSPGVTDMLGWTTEEFLAQSYLDLVHPEDKDATMHEVQRQIASGEKVLNFENRYRHKNGSWRLLSWRSVPDASTGLMYATARDVTESRRAQAELDRFFTLSVDFLCIAGLDGYFKRASPSVQEILGWTVEEFLARPFIELIHPDDRESTAREADKLAAGQKVLAFENRYRHKDGSWRVLSWRATPHLEAGLLYCSGRDVTEVRRTEEQIRRLNTDLEERAAQQAAANKELEAFSYSVSHDLRAPLRHVQGYVEMLTRESEGALNDKSRRYLKTISQASREMGELIDDLLEFSRMGRSEMSDGEVDIAKLVAEVRRSLEPTVGERDVRWTIAPLPAVRGDAAMLRQVLANLLGNAVKYTRDRKPAEIAVGCAGEEEGRLVFFVRDNGAGFDMKYADKLFGVFQRLHRSDEFEGTGIGLASVRRIVARHNGRTWAEGRLQEGATFYFTLKPAGIPAVPQPNHRL